MRQISDMIAFLIVANQAQGCRGIENRFGQHAAKGISTPELTRLQGLSLRRNYLFRVYVEQMFKRRVDHPYTPEQISHWLSWLAQKMSEHAQTIFLIEQLQPTWLQTRPQRWLYLSIVGLGVGLSIGLIFWLSDGLMGGLMNGLIIGLIIGGLAVIQHFVLRFILFRNGYVPWNYVRFLDYTAKCILLRKVGGGYIFTHRLLLEYFAELNQKD